MDHNANTVVDHNANTSVQDPTPQEDTLGPEINTPMQGFHSPQHVEEDVRDEGRNIHELLRLYKETTTEPLSSFVLSTPTHKIKQKDATTKQAEVAVVTEVKKHKERKSPRLQAKLAKGKTVVKMAQELVARKCGILEEDQEVDNMILQQYMDMYKKPLTDESTEAIMKLTEVAEKEEG